MVDDSIQDSTISAELSKTYENKYNPYDVILLGGIGYTSTRRIEIDVLSAAFNIGTKFFGIDWLLADYTFLRFDRRLERTEDGKKIYESSIWGIASSLLGLATLSMADSINTTFGKIAFGTLWLTSGYTKFILYRNNLGGISLLSKRIRIHRRSGNIIWNFPSSNNNRRFFRNNQQATQHLMVL